MGLNNASNSDKNIVPQNSNSYQNADLNLNTSANTKDMSSNPNLIGKIRKTSQANSNKTKVGKYQFTSNQPLQNE